MLMRVLIKSGGQVQEASTTGHGIVRDLLEEPLSKHKHSTDLLSECLRNIADGCSST